MIGAFRRAIAKGDAEKQRPEPAQGVVFVPISPELAKATPRALLGLDESDPVLGAVLLVLADYHASLVQTAEGALPDGNVAMARLGEARGVAGAMRLLVRMTRNEWPRGVQTRKTGGGEPRRSHG